MKIKDMIIVSDLDGTVIPMSGVVSQGNKAAIKRFTDLGGIFTIATGRTPIHATQFAKELFVNTPFIAGNGSIIYDPQSEKALWEQCFLKQSNETFKELIEKFPHIGVVLIDTNDAYHIINNSKSMEEHVKTGYMKTVFYHEIDDFPQNCRSGWLSLDKDEFTEIVLWIAHNKSKFVEFTISGECFIDILPGGVSKGACFEKLICDIYNRSLDCSVAIGDFPNDIEMIKEAGLGVAVLNAHEEVKAVADLIVKSCDDDAIADLIDYLIKNES